MTPLPDRDQLILEHLYLVNAMAVDLHMSLPKSVELADLKQIGTLGLISAAKRYDASSNVPFGAFARHRIKGAMLDSLRKSDVVSRKLREFGKRIEAASSQLAITLNRPATEVELAEKLGVDLTELREAVGQLWSVGQVSMSGFEDANPMELPTPPESSADNIYARKEYAAILTEAIKQLPDRDQALVKSLFYEERSQKDFSVAFGIHQSRVSQIRKRVCEKLAVILREQGIDSGAAA